MNPHQVLAIISNASSRKSLSAVRALGKAGFQVAAIDVDPWAPALHSKYCAFRLRRRPEETLIEATERVLQRLGSKLNFSKVVILPMEESCVRELSTSEIHPRISWLAPPLDQLVVVEDKSRTLRFASGRLQPPCRTPVSLELRAAQQIPEMIEKVIADPRRDWVFKPMQGKSALGVRYWSKVDSPQASVELSDLLHELFEIYGPQLLQERIAPQGQAFGVSAMFDQESQLRVLHTHRRIHQYPMSGGPSTLRETCEIPELEAASVSLLRQLNWQGVAMVEWKQDPQSGDYVLMEINGRFWGSLELAIRAGADFPVQYVRIALGESQVETVRSRLGVSCRWLIPGDFLRWISDPQREGLGAWLRAAWRDSEEIDAKDWRGFWASVVFTLSLLFRPSYWKYLRRGH